MTDQIKDLQLGSREVISWKSKDGAEIEGILIKPAGFDASKRGSSEKSMGEFGFG